VSERQQEQYLTDEMTAEINVQLQADAEERREQEGEAAALGVLEIPAGTEPTRIDLNWDQLDRSLVMGGNRIGSSLNDFFEQLFASSKESDKHIIMGAVYPSPSVAGGNIMWRRKKRFAKKRRKWMEKMMQLSAERFMGITSHELRFHYVPPTSMTPKALRDLEATFEAHDRACAEAGQKEDAT
jgi:hypothetical protein